MINLHTRLNVIRQCVHNYTEHYKTQMVRNANESTRSLTLTVGDYVFLQRQRTGALQKLQNIYAGVFIVHSVDSVTLMYAIPQDLCSHYFNTSTSDTTTSAPLLVLQRPTWFWKKPIRIHDEDHVDHIADTISSFLQFLQTLVDCIKLSKCLLNDIWIKDENFLWKLKGNQLKMQIRYGYPFYLWMLKHKLLLGKDPHHWFNFIFKYANCELSFIVNTCLCNNKLNMHYMYFQHICS